MDLVVLGLIAKTAVLADLWLVSEGVKLDILKRVTETAGATITDSDVALNLDNWDRVD